MAGKKWTKEEEEYLLKNYKKANRVLAKHLIEMLAQYNKSYFVWVY